MWVINSMHNFFYSFRTRIIYLFIKSLLCAAAITFTVYKLLQFYYHHYVMYEDSYTYYRQMMREFGDINAFLIIYIPLSILLFYLFTRTYSNYFTEISAGIRHLADGDFTYNVQVESKDEFRQIATDLNEASRLLQEAINAQTLSQRSKETLIANLAHDLRTPLTSVIGYLNLLNEQRELSGAQKDEYTRIAYTKSIYLEELIGTLFDVSKLDLSLQVIEKTPIDIQQLLLQLLDEMDALVEERDVSITKQIDSNLFIMGNGKELARVFENLLSNALFYGDLSQPIRVKAEKRGVGVHIRISNHGAPIEKEKLPHLFDMFYTVDQVRNIPSKQTGLGLYIAKTIVEKHDGTIQVWNGDGQIHFDVLLPVDLRNI